MLPSQEPWETGAHITAVSSTVKAQPGSESLATAQPASYKTCQQSTHMPLFGTQGRPVSSLLGKVRMTCPWPLQPISHTETSNGTLPQKQPLEQDCGQLGLQLKLLKFRSLMSVDQNAVGQSTETFTHCTVHTMEVGGLQKVVTATAGRHFSLADSG